MRRVPWHLWALAFLSGLLQCLPFPLANPVSDWRRLTCWFCLTPLLFALCGNDVRGNGLSPLQSALLAYGCGVVWFLGNCYWIYQTMFHYGGLPPIAAALILLLFALYLGLYFALLGAVFALLRRFRGSNATLALFPFLWVAVELARARITGFPWDLLGYTQVNNSLLLPLAPITGVMGLSLLVACGNALWLWRPRQVFRWAGPVLGACLIGGNVAGQVHHSAALPAKARAVLLQENLSVGAEANGPRETERDMVRSFAAYTTHPRSSAHPGQRVNEALQARPPALLAWPEAPTSFADGDPNLRDALGAFSRQLRAPLVVDAVGVGGLEAQGSHSEEYVSASFYLPDGSYAGRYDKMHLVPFGEYTPYKRLFFFAGHLLDGLNFVPGTQRRLFSVGGHRFGVFICYESIFGDEIRAFARSGAQVLVNLSDDGWYGDTSAPWEHLDMARMRAVENRRWLLRATNTGLTASIDPNGRIVAALPRHVRDAIEVPFAYRDDVTFYTEHGDWLGWLCAFLVLAVTAGGALETRYPLKPRQQKSVLGHRG